jgi:pyrimidine operon attenuation protein/uracil phosphoribosyltransferase
VYIAQRLAERIAEVESLELQVGALDITMYRDDFRMRISQPAVRETNIPFDITGKHLVLVDDVVYTGRTARSAFDALMDMGRPASIHYLVVVDRGLRELPIRPDMVGRDVPTLPGEEVRVRVQELDQLEGVWLVEREATPHHLSRTERT